MTCEVNACYSLTIEYDSNSIIDYSTCTCATVSLLSSKLIRKSIKQRKKQIQANIIKNKNHNKKLHKHAEKETGLNLDDIDEDTSIYCPFTTSGTRKYCNCEDSCSDISGTLYSYYHCRGYQSCSNSIFNSRTGVYNWGYYAGQLSTFSNTDQIGCNGHYACQNAIIDTCTEVYVSGYGALESATKKLSFFTILSYFCTKFVFHSFTFQSFFSDRPMEIFHKVLGLPS